MTTIAPRLAYNRRDAAAQLGVSQDVIDKAIKGGDLPSFRLTVTDPKTGKPRKLSTVMVTHEALARWVAESGGRT